MPKTNKRSKAANQSQQPMPIVGIDLGTTNSAVAILEARQPVLIPGPNGSSLLPSVVHRTPDGQIVVGSDAEGARVAMPNRTVAAAKRHMGSDTTLQLGDTSLRAEEISSLVLKELKTWVHRHLQLDDDQPVEAVITVPAYFTDEQRRATKRAGELAGFVVERIINEPTAAALAFGLGRTDQEQTLVVYDLGGGTFDVSVVELFDGILEVKASKGNSHLGGEDFDWLLVNHLAQMVTEQTGADPLSELRAKALLKQHAEAAKKELSFQESVEVNIPLLMFHDGNPVPLTVTLQRSEFTALIASHIEETMASVRTVLEDSDLQPTAVDAVLLVGGSTRIPLVQQAIIDVFGKQPLMDVNPDEAVALGAAVQAGIKSGEISAETLIATDVAPFSMGISVAENHGTHITEGHFSIIIPRNTTIPTKRTESYVTTYPGQKAVEIEVYQGEGAMVAENHPLGEFHFEGFPVNPYREEVFTVTFGYNLNGILEVEAQSVSNGKTISVQIHDQIDRDSKAAFQDSLKRLQSLQEQRRSEYQQESLPLHFELPEPLAVDGDDPGADLLDDGTVETIWDLENHMPDDVKEFLADLRDAPEEEIVRLGEKALEMIDLTLSKDRDLPRLMKRQLKTTQRDLKQGLRRKDRAAIIEAVLLTSSVAMLPQLMSGYSEED